jgi:hypothetical protein
MPGVGASANLQSGITVIKGNCLAGTEMTSKRCNPGGCSEMKCVACGSTALVGGILKSDDGSTPSFYPSDAPLLRRIFAIGGRAVRAYGCVHCQHLQLAIEFREDDLERYQQFEGEQPDVLERISSQPKS